MFCIDLIQIPIFGQFYQGAYIFLYQIKQIKQRVLLIYFQQQRMKQDIENIEKGFLNESRKRRHKSEFFYAAQFEGRLLKPKRLSCMRASELLQIEESQTQVANYVIQQILTNVFHSLVQVRTITKMCTQQLTDKVNLLDGYQIYTMVNMPEEQELQIRLEEEPTNQPNFKVIPRKDKNQENYPGKDVLSQEFNKTNSSNSKTKFNKKQKLFKIPSALTTSQLTKSNNSIHSTKSNLNLSYSLAYRYPKRIQQEIEYEKEKDKRLREEIIKKLMKQYQAKLKENPHPCPEPLLHEQRSFFIQPQTKEDQNLRVSYLQLRQLRSAQQKANQRKPSKRTSTLLTTAQNSSRQNTNSLYLPKIKKSTFGTKKQEGTGLFTQDDNGKAIKVKNYQRVQTREQSNTTYESYVKPRQTALKEILNIYKPSVQYVKNDKIKDQASFLNENASIVSTLCQSMSVDEQMLDKSILENFVDKKGVFMKKSMFQHRSTKSIEATGLRLPSILKRK